MTSKTFDNTWEKIYSSGHSQRYPWDAVVSFVFRHRPRDKTHEETSVLEVGCGSASNLWFAAREGFEVAGIDGSVSAIEGAKKRFETENLNGDLRVMDYTSPLPWPKQSFDLAIDRAAIVCAGNAGAKKAIDNVHDALEKGGKFLSLSYSASNIERSKGIKKSDGLFDQLAGGPLQGIGQVCMWSKSDMERLFPVAKWRLLEFDHISHVSEIDSEHDLHIWRIVAEKI